jgi:hypothetical protein
LPLWTPARTMAMAPGARLGLRDRACLLNKFLDVPLAGLEAMRRHMTWTNAPRNACLAWARQRSTLVLLEGLYFYWPGKHNQKFKLSLTGSAFRKAFYYIKLGLANVNLCRTVKSIKTLLWIRTLKYVCKQKAWLVCFKTDLGCKKANFLVYTVAGVNAKLNK